jgi:hypothetical protein
MKAKEMASLLQRNGIRVEKRTEEAGGQPVVRLKNDLFVTIYGDEDFTLSRESSPGVVQPLGGFNTIPDLARAISRA